MNLKHFSKYIVIDSYGTKKQVWSLREATAWLGYCSPEAVVMNRWTKKAVSFRLQKFQSGRGA